MVKMAIIKSISTKNITNLDKYILNGEAHDKTLTTHRNLYVGGHNVKKDYGGHYNAMYTASQNYAVRKQAGKAGKKTQGFHLIISFSEQDFPKTNNKKKLQEQAQQAYQLVSSLLNRELPRSSQYLIGIQRDGTGGMLHAHVSLNSVLMDGKTLNTNQLSLNHKLTLGKQKDHVRERKKEAGLYQRTQDFFEENFEKVTGRKYQRIERDTADLVQANEAQLKVKGVKPWKDTLKDEIVEVAQNSVSTDDFKQKMKDVYDVDVLDTDKKGKPLRMSIGKDDNGKKIYRKMFTYRIKDDDGHVHKTRDFYYRKNGAVRGLGTDYTPDSLEKQFELVRQRQQQAINQKINEINNTKLEKVEVVSNGTQSIQSTNTRTNEPEEPEPTRTIKQIKQIKTTSKVVNFDTSTYDERTKQLEQRNIDELIRQQQQADANAEQERRERDKKRKERELKRRRQQEQARRYSQATNNDQKQKYPDAQPTGNTVSKPSSNEPNPWEFE